MEIDTPLRRLRRARDLTLETVAQGVGTDTGNLSRIERGTQKSLDLAAKLVAYFDDGITEAEILYPERFPPPDQGTAAPAERAA